MLKCQVNKGEFGVFWKDYYYNLWYQGRIVVMIIGA